MSIPEYRLRWLRVIYISKQARELEQSIATLEKTLDASHLLSKYKLHNRIIFTRMPRRRLAVTVSKAIGSKVGQIYMLEYKGSRLQDVCHHIFEDYRYCISFHNVWHPSETLTSIIGSMVGQTECRCNFQWHYEVSPHNKWYTLLDSLGGKH